MNKRVSINCPNRTTPDKKPLQIGQIGFTRSNTPAIYLHCRGHGEFHAHTLTELLRRWRQMGNDDVQAMRAYIDTLKKAVVEAEVDMQTMVGDVIIADKTEEND